MAINFLDNIQLNQNQLLGARLENVTSDPGTANGGDIIFNSTSKKLKYYNETEWIGLPDGIGIGGSGTINTVPIFKTDTTTIGNSIIAQDSGASQIKVSGNFWATGKLLDSGGDAGTAGQLLSSTGSLTNWIDAPVSYTKWVIKSDSSAGENVNDGDIVDFTGSSTNPGIVINTSTKSGTTITQPIGLNSKNLVDVVPSNYSTHVLLWSENKSASNFKINRTFIDQIDLNAWGTASGAIDMGSNLINNVTDPSSAQDAATKAYVDSTVAGGLTVKGGFNANTGVTAVAGTDLYTNTVLAVGDYYVVTVAGNFFGNTATPLTIGDSVLVQTAAASGSGDEDDFAVIQSDTDLATTTSPGIASFPAAEFGVTAGAVSLANSGVTAATYGSATQVSRFAVNVKGIVTSANNETIAIPHTQITDFDDEVKALITAREFSGTSSSGTSHVFTHNLGTDDVIVQIFDASTKETVYASVDRTSTNAVTVTTAATANIRCLITKIG